MYRTPIDHSNGEVSVIGNDIFYSPNCPRKIFEVPPPADQTRGLFGLSKPATRSHRIGQYHEPRWWTPAFGWLSFLPLQPTFTGYPLDRLANIPCLQKSPQGYYLPIPTVDSWKRLENCLCRAVFLLRLKYSQGMILPWTPCAWGYHAFEKNHAKAKGMNLLSVEWFVLWITAYSWLIAVGRFLPRDAGEDEVEGMEDWFTVLREDGYNEIWLDGLALTMAADFTPHTPRVGVFLDISKPGLGQPSPRWFIKHGIPIWYRPESVPDGKDWSDFKVPMEKLNHPEQLALPPPPSPHPHPSPASPSPPSTQTPPKKPWIEFFARRAQRNMDIKARETPAQTKQRENREKNPGQVKAKVFEWSLNDDDPRQWVRNEINKKAKQDTLSYYSGAQCVFDAFRNEWDCCEEFGDPEEMDDDDDGDEGYPEPVPNFIEPNEPNKEYELPERQQSPSPPPLTDDNVVSENPEVFQIRKVLYRHFGFIVPPLADVNRTPPVTTAAQRKKFLHSLGLSGTEHGIFTVSLGSVIWDFIHGLSDTPLRRPDPAVWDLNRDNPESLFLNTRFLGNLYRVGESFVFFSRWITTDPWHIMVTTAGDALYICRLPQDYTREDIAVALLQEGIRFRTLAPVPDLPRSLPCPELALPRRSENYVFTKRDYDAYIDQRNVILRGPRGRAALMRGGYVWRLARATVSQDSVLEGPFPDGGPTTCFENGLEFLWDNELSETELDLICGAYICDTSE
jgi:hypothetical protein